VHDHRSVEVKLALAGDTMLGRRVAERLHDGSPQALFAPQLIEAAHEADLLLLNLECCISSRGEPWPDPEKPFFFRAPPAAVEALALLGVDCVTLANNHALDFGPQALLDTLDYLAAAGIACVGAGRDDAAARGPALLTSAGGFRLAVIGATDHPREYKAEPDRPGVAYASLRRRVPGWLRDGVAAARASADAVLVTAHWGPNMAPRPLSAIRSAAAALVESGATLVAGHSAHVFHGVEGPVLYDLGDFVDDYRVDPVLRNDLGLLFLVTLDERGPHRLEALPLKLEYCHTRLATGEDAAWIRRRFRDACRELGTEVGEEAGRLTVTW
jgi:poly-gamma-glutamate capsule biosynthesis protein CapA/YwtB (metallophosphatase superfamily)